MVASSSRPTRRIQVKSALSLTLIACLMTSAFPAAAQNQTEPPASFDLRGPATAGPLAQAAMREAVRLAAVGEPRSTGIETVQQGGQSTESNWSRVRKLAPGTEIIVTVKGSPPATRYFVAADESDLTVLNVADPTLPRAAREVLRDVASTHPEHFLAAQKGGQFVLEKNIRVAPDGVFVADRKVADLTQVIETIARNDVAEISGPVPYSPGHEALVGLGVGAAIGAGIYLLLCHGFGGCGGADVGPLLGTAALFGGIFAGISLLPGGYHARHRPWEVIYRAP
jgi:hypothetical protein